MCLPMNDPLLNLYQDAWLLAKFAPYEQEDAELCAYLQKMDVKENQTIVEEWNQIKTDKEVSPVSNCVGNIPPVATSAFLAMSGIALGSALTTGIGLLASGAMLVKGNQQKNKGLQAEATEELIDKTINPNRLARAEEKVRRIGKKLENLDDDCDSEQLDCSKSYFSSNLEAFKRKHTVKVKGGIW